VQKFARHGAAFSTTMSWVNTPGLKGMGLNCARATLTQAQASPMEMSVDFIVILWWI
jgi:hypothetical protein